MVSLVKSDSKVAMVALSDNLRRYLISFHLQGLTFSFDFEIADRFSLLMEQT